MKPQLVATLPLRDKEPILFMMPCAHGSGVVVVREKRLELVRYNDLVNGHLDFAECQLLDQPTAWFREPRNSELEHMTDNIMGEEGEEDVMYVSTKNGGIYAITTTDGHLNVDPIAQTGIDLGCSFVLQGYDLESQTLVDGFLDSAEHWLMTFGGDMSTGGSLLISVDNSGGVVENSLERHENWAPLFDLRALSLSARVGSLSPRFELFGATLQTNETGGSISRLRYGVEATLAFPGPRMDRLHRIFSIPEEKFLIASFPYKTALYLVANDEGFPSLDDMSAWEIIDSKSQTIAIGYVPLSRSVIQITETHIWVSNVSKEGSKVGHELQNTTIGDCKGSWVVAVSSALPGSKGQAVEGEMDIESSTCSFFTVEGGVLQPHTSATIQSGVSVAKLMMRKDTVYCIFGTYTGNLLVCRLQRMGHGEELEWIHRLSMVDNKVPHDVYVRGDDLLVSLRDGSYARGKFIEKVGNLAIEMSRDITRLGAIPITFIEMQMGNTDSVKAGIVPNTVILLAGQLWTILNGEFENPPWDLLTDRRSEITSICHFPTGPNHLAIVSNGKLKVYELCSQPGIAVMRTNINLSQGEPYQTLCPRRLQYVQHVRFFAVAINDGQDLGKKLGQLAFYDPYRDDVVGNGPIIDGKKNTTIFEIGECVQCMCEWTLTANGERYSYLVVGTSADKGGQKMGRILILRLKRVDGQNSPRVTCQYKWQADAGVLAVCPISENAFVYSTGAPTPQLHVRRMEIDGDRLQFSTFASDRLRSAIVNLTVRGDLIFASTMKDSIMVFRWTGTEIILHQADSIQRSIVTHINVSDDLILAADKNRYLIGLRLTDGTSLETVFYVRFPSLVSRIVGLDEPRIWSASEAGAGDVAKCFVLAGVDGALYGVRLLNINEQSHLWQLRSQMSQAPLHFEIFSPITASKARYVGHAPPDQSANAFCGDGLRLDDNLAHSSRVFDVL
jgi:hypothetical protein